MGKKFRSIILGLILMLSFSITSQGNTIEQNNISLSKYSDLEFNLPVEVIYSHYHNGILVVEKSGTIQLIVDDTKQIFLDITNKVSSSSSEMGLLGLALHPDFSDNGKFYVDYTVDNPRRTIIAEYVMGSDNTTDINSETIILEVEQPYANHNAGKILFADEGYLYITLGDGGSGGDPQNNGQDPTTLLGSILRIDVDQQSGEKAYSIPADNPFANHANYLPEIYAYGLRNPWKMSYDTESELLIAGDVGQNEIEEINIIEKGQNYGWNEMEGSSCFVLDCNKTGKVLPFTEYTHDVGYSVTGGYIVRDTSSVYYGWYVFGDFGTGKIFVYNLNDMTSNYIQLLDTELAISSFGNLPNGQLLVVDYSGSIYSLQTSQGDNSQTTGSATQESDLNTDDMLRSENSSNTGLSFSGFMFLVPVIFLRLKRRHK